MSPSPASGPAWPVWTSKLQSMLVAASHTENTWTPYFTGLLCRYCLKKTLPLCLIICSSLDKHCTGVKKDRHFSRTSSCKSLTLQRRSLHGIFLFMVNHFQKGKECFKTLAARDHSMSLVAIEQQICAPIFLDRWQLVVSHKQKKADELFISSLVVGSTGHLS